MPPSRRISLFFDFGGLLPGIGVIIKAEVRERPGPREVPVGVGWALPTDRVFSELFCREKKN